MNTNNLSRLFFKELKTYNKTNFRTLQKACLEVDDPVTHKAFSSVITRFFIFCEKHPELDTMDCRILFFQLKIDMVARYFSNYPELNLDELKAFQLELRKYINETEKEEELNAEREPAQV